MKSFLPSLLRITFLFCLIFSLSVESGFSQTYNMRDTTVTHCSGTLFDTGGNASDYSNDEDSSFTITVPFNATITIDFVSFDLRGGGGDDDEVIIYDGADTMAAVLAGPFDGNTNPGSFTSTGQSITIRFKSDGSGNDPGFEMTWLAADTITTALSASANPFCLGSPVTFTVTDSSGAGDPDFAWEINGSAAGGSTNSYQYTTSALQYEDTVRVIMTGEAGGCYFQATDTAEIVMDTIVNIAPSVTIAASDYGICEGEDATFTVTDSTNGGTDPTFQWQVNGVNAGTDSYQFVTNALMDNDLVRVYMTSNSSLCLSTNTDTSTAITMNVNGNPSVSISSQINVACVGVDTGSAAAMTTGGSGTIAYSWNTAPVQTAATATGLPLNVTA